MRRTLHGLFIPESILPRGARAVFMPAWGMPFARPFAAAGGVPTGPFSDTFTRADGAIGNGWTGATWTIASNAAINTPATLGAETLADPGLEGNYTAGLCDSWAAKNGTPTVSQSADVHGGSKAQAFTAAAYNDYLRMLATPSSWTLGTWTRGSAWVKRLSGTDGNTAVELRSTNWTHTGVGITFAAYTQTIVHARCMTVNSMSFYVPLKQTTGAGDAVVVDDLSLKALTLSELIATHTTGIDTIYTANVDVTVPSQATTGIMTLAGLALNVDSTSNPQNFILAHITGKPGTNQCLMRLEKCIGGTYTTLISVSGTYSAGATLKVVRNGTTFQLFYNNTQVGTDQTVSDTPNATNHGLFSLHPNGSFKNFSIA